jgi:hypothetical protein
LEACRPVTVVELASIINLHSLNRCRALGLEAEALFGGKFHPTRRSRNGATAGCWREFIDLMSTGCAPRFSHLAADFYRFLFACSVPSRTSRGRPEGLHRSHTT